MQRKHILIRSSVVACLVLFGVVGWALFMRIDEKPATLIPPVMQVPAGMRPLEMAEKGNFGVESEALEHVKIKWLISCAYPVRLRYVD